ncbi:MAG: glycosyltransferase family 1 protein [Candidatus Dojkabacteria bacterium]|nr:glycosyltransferase family 1 protein [Candidatus Dojkabacteria bacterium]
MCLSPIFSTSSKKPRLLIISDTSSRQVNGVVTTLKNLCLELEKSYEVYLLDSDFFTSFSCPFYKEIRLSIFPKSALRSYLLSVKPHFIHIATEGPLGFAAVSLCKQYSLPFTTSYHTMFPEYLWTYFYFPKFLTYSYLRSFHKHSSFILATTPTMKTLLELHGFSSVVTWTRGVDKSIFKPTGPTHHTRYFMPRPIFGYVGRISKEKNLDDFLRAPLPGTKVIVGDGPYLSTLQRKYSKNKNIFSTLFVGYAFGEDLAAWYRTFDACVFPSKTDTFGITIIESLSCGTPVIGYNVQGPKDILQHGYNGFLANSFEEFVIYCNRYEQISKENCIASAASYTWKNCAEVFQKCLVFIPEKHYDSILKV